MHPQLRLFVTKLAAVAMAALVPVVMTAFVSIPWNLQGHPGEPQRTSLMSVPKHMT